MDEEHFSLKWNNFHLNIQSVFSSLLAKENLVDVTLACEGKKLRCHKIVLSAGSAYFEDLFTSEDHRPSVVFLKGVEFAHLQAVVQFMYCGEVEVPQQEFPSLMQLAMELRVKGLADDNSSRITTPPAKKRRKHSPDKEVLKPAAQESSILGSNSSNDHFWSAEDDVYRNTVVPQSPTRVADTVSISLVTDSTGNSVASSNVATDSITSEEPGSLNMMSYLNPEVEQHDPMKMPIYCQICWKSFKSTQGLSVHMICIHGHKLDKPSHQKIEETSPSEDVPYIPESPCERARDTRRSYDAVFKSEVMSRVDAGETIGCVAESYQINKSLICRWLKNKQAINEAASHPNLNLAKLHHKTASRELTSDTAPYI